jgi:hypothetical protein
VLCVLDTKASHNFITRKNVEKMELQLEELKAPNEVHFGDGVPHPTTLQAGDVLLQVRNWRRKGGLVGFHFRGDGMHFGSVIHHP